jgi:Methyltransferase domain
MTTALDTWVLRRYFERMNSLPGWFLPDAALMFMAYNQLVSDRVVPGNTLEIGVYHGKSAIAVASLRGEAGIFTAIDVFDDLQSRDGSSHDVGLKGVFLANMAASFPTLNWMRPIVAPSSTVRAQALGPQSFCHIDGLHSAEGTYGDMRLCAEVVVPGGLVALDDYFNQRFPGVSEGALSFERRHPGVLTPVAVGFNKVLFQRASESDLNERFAREFDYIPTNITTMWGRPVALFESPIEPCVDLDRSTPHRLVPRPESRLTMRATIEPGMVALSATRGQALTIPVRVVNRTSVDFGWSIGLSYHVFSSDGRLVRWDNPRSHFYPVLSPGAEQQVNLGVIAPEAEGAYTLELDMVWEGIAWFKDKGNRTSTIALTVN